MPVRPGSSGLSSRSTASAQVSSSDRHVTPKRRGTGALKTLATAP
jgi:hypothetical protein